MIVMMTMMMVARFFNDWVDQVKAEIPADRLLVFEVKQVVLCIVTRAVNEPLRRFRSTLLASLKRSIFTLPASLKRSILTVFKCIQ